jgi:hypothetical protein
MKDEGEMWDIGRTIENARRVLAWVAGPITALPYRESNLESLVIQPVI